MFTMRRNLLLWLTLVLFALTTPVISRAAVVEPNGQNLLPPGSKTVTSYQVKPGDTLWNLAQTMGVQVSTLMSQNHITNPRLLQIGQVLTYTHWARPNSASTVRTRDVKSSRRPVTTKDLAGSIPVRTSHDVSLTTGNGLSDAKVLYCTLTAYTAGPESTGKYPGQPGYGITSTGQEAVQGVTVAVDPQIIPYGTKLYIPGIGYRVAEDTGGAINGDHIDIFYNQQSTAVDFGVKYHQKVYILPNWYHIPLS